MKPFLKKSLFVLAIVLLGFEIHWTQSAMDSHRVIRFVNKRPVFLPKGRVLKWMSVGYRGLVADWLWIESVLYYGRRVTDEDNPYYVYMLKKEKVEEEFKNRPQVSPVVDSITGLAKDLSHILYRFDSRGLVDYIYPMLDRVTTLDPHFISPYIFGGVYVLMETGEIDASLKLLQKGYKTNPERWQLPFYLGWIEWMYKGNIEETYKYLLEAVRKEGCPRYVGDLLTGLSAKLGRSELTKRYLRGLLKSTDNPEIKKQIKKLLQEIEDRR